jgi:magnesium-transporting ATPase (P-type)
MDQVVVGDIMYLEAGDIVTIDGIIIKSNDLELIEPKEK